VGCGGSSDPAMKADLARLEDETQRAAAIEDLVAAGGASGRPS